MDYNYIKEFYLSLPVIFLAGNLCISYSGELLF
jgi:hypothetical protein